MTALQYNWASLEMESPRQNEKRTPKKTPSGNMFELRLRIGAGHTWTTLKSSGKEEVEKGDP